MVRIRAGTVADADGLAGLSRELLTYYGIPPPAPRWSMAEAIRQNVFGAGKTVEVLIAERDGVVVGMLAFAQVYSLALCQDSFFIQDIFVSERWRGEGLGRQLMEHLGLLADERGVTQIDWTADPWNDRARRFYEQLGPHQRVDKTFYRIAGHNLRFFIKRIA
jgi:GNAT superfamily N-acetyltransferase